MSMLRMRACGCGERRSLQWTMRGREMSSAKRVCPVTLARGSTRRGGGGRVRGAEEFAVDHAGKGNVIGEAGLPGDFGAGIHAAAWMANYAEFAIISVGLFLWGIFLLRHRR